MLHRIALSMTANSTEADDLVQETYYRATRSWETFRLKSHGIRPWLVRIMHNANLDRLSKSKGQTSFNEEALATVKDRASAVTEVIDKMDDRVAAALERLAPEYRTVLLLWAVDEMAYSDIAASLGIPIGTVMSRLHRARQKLAADLNRELH